MKLDFNDYLIVPKATTSINNRHEITITRNNRLPLITAPMDTVISSDNVSDYILNKILVCTPRNVQNEHGVISLSIDRAISLYELGWFKEEHNAIYLIDIANGHMEKLLNLTKKIKSEFPLTKLMVGNIANPETYRILSEAGADYIRVGIGNGGGCLTTQQTGVGYPMASLIKECYEISTKLKKPAYIVADGGMKTYSDIIKALALGADWVMVGSIFNKAIESAGDNYLWKRIKVSLKTAKKAYKLGIPVYKSFRGMSTKEVQKQWGSVVPKTSEGITSFRRVEYTLSQWCENFSHYLRSAMSYTGAKSLYDFIGKVELVQISDNAYKRFNK